MTINMTIPTHNAQARSQFFQLLALGFAHPIPELHTLLLNGSYTRALAQAAHDGFGIDPSLSPLGRSFADFEAEYIDIFQVGRGGKPRVHLNAGDHDELSKDHSRPEFLLLYSGWYKHFGLQTAEQTDTNELPDHIVCQLEFLAWLTHLETAVGDDSELRLGYQRAQRDFCERQLQPFLELLVNSLQHSRANRFYLELAVLTLESTETLQAVLATNPDDASTQSEAISVVNLWE
jgi:DMSO reductase family type II enzyme chaperone